MTGQTKVSISKRAWVRWHPSTFLLMLFPATFWMLVAVPSQYHVVNWSILESREHGWPAIHLVQTQEAKKPISRINGNQLVWAKPSANEFPSTEKFWSNLENWNYFLWDKRVWSTKGLAVNLAALGGFCLPFGFICEFRRRRRNSFWQFRIVDLLMLIAAVGIGLGWWQSVEVRSSAVAKAVDSFQLREVGSVGLHANSPLWLKRITDFRISFLRKHPRSADWPNVPLFPRITYAGCRNQHADGTSVSDPHLTAEELNLMRPRRVEIRFLDRNAVTMFELLNPGYVKHIRVWIEPNLPHHCNDLSFLSRFKNLTALEIKCDQLASAEFGFPIFSQLTFLELNGHFDEQTINWVNRLPKLVTLGVSPSLFESDGKLLRDRIKTDNPDFKFASLSGIEIWNRDKRH